jgi:thiol-disulfide isomerase/thioredoxin
LSSSTTSTIDQRPGTQAADGANFLEQVKQMLRREALRIVKETTERDQALNLGSKSDLPNLYELQTIQDYKKIVEDSDNKLTVVQFSAPFCLACKASLPLVRKMAQDMPDVNFVLLTVTKQNRYDVRDLGVPSLPYGYVHHPQRGLVEKLSTNKRHLADFARVVESYREHEHDLLDEGKSESGVYSSPFVRAA